MKQLSLKTKKLWISDVSALTGSPTRMYLSVLAVLISAALVTAGVRAYNRAPEKVANDASRPISSPPVQGGGLGKSLAARLSLQPEADRFRRRIGKRFVESGRERATLVGRLTVGAEQYQVRVVRTQEVDGEQVEISLNGGPVSLTWNGREGARSGGRVATGIERSLIEKLALDSPDQFVLAQTRGASYYPVARGARPEEALGRDDYQGPIWDVIQVGEPQQFSTNMPESRWRLYLIDTATGLLDRTATREQQRVVEAEFEGWSKVAGELIPTQISWRRDKQLIMQLVISGAVHGSKN